MKLITVWLCDGKHNHISNGWSLKPKPLSDVQARVWANAQWTRRWALLINNKVRVLW